jgi:RimJ/RimL family protein N-acetyltransferase
MDFAEFNAFHMPALEQAAAKYTLILSLMERAANGDPRGPTRKWSFGRPGACAIQTPARPIIFGDLARDECEQFAQELVGTRFVGVTGPDESPLWFVDHAKALGERFAEPMPQRILAMSEAPAFPGAPGEAVPVTIDDADLFAEWFEAFRLEAVPEDPPVTREQMDRKAASGDCLFWMVDGRPVSMAGIVRRTPTAAAIALVYTPPELRSLGYAGSATAAVVEKIYVEGCKIACLYVDQHNPASNRCYQKIGFKPVCESWMFRQTE